MSPPNYLEGRRSAATRRQAGSDSVLRHSHCPQRTEHMWTHPGANDECLEWTIHSPPDGGSVDVFSAAGCHDRGIWFPLIPAVCADYADVGINGIMPISGLCRVDLWLCWVQGFCDEKRGIIRTSRPWSRLPARLDLCRRRIYPHPARGFEQHEGFSVLGHGKSFAITATALSRGRGRGGCPQRTPTRSPRSSAIYMAGLNR
jgi:hypothetical protein